MKIKQPVQAKARIEMIPLIDSFFLILVYFIYSFLSMSIHKTIPLTLPEAKTGVHVEREFHELSLTADGKNYLDGQPCAFPQCLDQVESLWKQASAGAFNFYLRADEKVLHGHVVTVLDRLREIGLQHVSIETSGEKAHEPRA